MIGMDLKSNCGIRGGSIAALWLAMLMVAALAGGASAQDSDLSVTALYPAPSGVYRKIMTTDSATLARDGGRVVIGSAAPTALLNVGGDLSIQQGMFSLGQFAADPVGEFPEGSMYYNTTLHRVRVYQKGWSEVARTMEVAEAFRYAKGKIHPLGDSPGDAFVALTGVKPDGRSRWRISKTIWGIQCNVDEGWRRAGCWAAGGGLDLFPFANACLVEDSNVEVTITCVR